MSACIYNQANYLKSAPTLDDLPADEGYEVAFIGRSNAGKSSAINVITNIKGLARVSKTPGRTQCMNLFSMDDERSIVDLPGYGYAKVPLTIKQRWEKAINQYLQKRQCLRGLILVMDIRHPLKELDMHLIEWAMACKVPTHVLLTKADKLKNNELKKTLRDVESELSGYGDLITTQSFSALQRSGIDEVRAVLDQWYEV